MRNLLDFLARHNHWFVFVLLEVISAVLLFKYNSYQGSVWFSSANAVSGRVYEASAAVGQYFSLVTVNRQLTQRNVYLEREVARMAQEHAEATADSSYLQRLQNNQTNHYRSVPARVVSSSLDRLNNFITIDKGEADGVKKDMGVVCGTGIVGIVYLTSAHYSVVIPVLHTWPWLFWLSALDGWRARRGLSRRCSPTCTLPHWRRYRYQWLFVGLSSGYARGQGDARV